MLGIGIWEMVLLAGIALVVIGPEKFPDFAKIALRTFRDLRGYMDEMKADIATELKPVKKEFKAVDQLTRYDSESYLRSITTPKPAAAKPLDPTAPPPATTEAGTPKAGDFGYDESKDNAPADEGPIDYQPHKYHAKDEDAVPEAEVAPETTSATSPAPDVESAPGTDPSDDNRREPTDDFDAVRQPDKLD
jgi:Tat protein translocase TatB subunit